jgi:hypothetical protein
VPVALAADDRRELPADEDSRRTPELLELDVLQAKTELLRDQLASRDDRDVLQDGLRRSPKPGALTATLANTPRSLLTTSVASASPSTSSAIIRSDLPCLAICSSSGRRSLTLAIFPSYGSSSGSSSAASIFSASVTKYGDRYPPVELHPLDDVKRRFGALGLLDGHDALVADFSMPRATSSPMALSLCAEPVATCCFSRSLCTGRDCARRPRSRCEPRGRVRA